MKSNNHLYYLKCEIIKVHGVEAWASGIDQISFRWIREIRDTSERRCSVWGRDTVSL